MITLPVQKLKKDFSQIASGAKKGQEKVIVLEDENTAMVMSQEEYETWKQRDSS